MIKVPVYSRIFLDYMSYQTNQEVCEAWLEIETVLVFGEDEDADEVALKTIIMTVIIIIIITNIVIIIIAILIILSVSVLASPSRPAILMPGVATPSIQNIADSTHGS